MVSLSTSGLAGLTFCLKAQSVSYTIIINASVHVCMRDICGCSVYMGGYVPRVPNAHNDEKKASEPPGPRTRQLRDGM